jgi:hypothetical protein
MQLGENMARYSSQLLLQDAVGNLRGAHILLKALARFCTGSAARPCCLIDPDAFALISDPDDRKSAALSAAARAPLVTNDGHVLAQSRAVGIEAVTPSGFLERAGACG